MSHSVSNIESIKSGVNATLSSITMLDFSFNSRQMVVSVFFYLVCHLAAINLDPIVVSRHALPFSFPSNRRGRREKCQNQSLHNQPLEWRGGKRQNCGG